MVIRKINPSPQTLAAEHISPYLFLSYIHTHTSIVPRVDTFPPLTFGNALLCLWSSCTFTTFLINLLLFCTVDSP